MDALSRIGEKNSIENVCNECDFVYASKGEEVISYEGQEPILREVFDLLENPETGGYRAVSVTTEQMPTELKNILTFVGEYKYVNDNVDEILFTPFLRNGGKKVLDGYSLINSGKRKVLIPIAKEYSNRLYPKDEVDTFDLIAREAKRLELSRWPLCYDKITLQKILYFKQLEVLEDFLRAYGDADISRNKTSRFINEKFLFIQSLVDEMESQPRAFV